MCASSIMITVFFILSTFSSIFDTKWLKSRAATMCGFELRAIWAFPNSSAMVCATKFLPVPTSPVITKLMGIRCPARAAARALAVSCANSAAISFLSTRFSRMLFSLYEALPVATGSPHHIQNLAMSLFVPLHFGHFMD